MKSWVNPKIKIKDAGQKGIGSFANGSITKGEVIIVQAGQIVANERLKEPRLEPFANHCFQVEDDFCICPIELEKEKLDGVFQINHSCEPNCGFRGQITLIAIRDIEPGEEITYDYAMTDTNYEGAICPEMRCLCGLNSCRGVVTGEDWKREELQKKYNGYFSRYIQKKINSGG